MKDGGDVDVLDVRSIRVGQALLKQFGLSGALLPRYIRGPADLHGEMWGLRQCTYPTNIHSHSIAAAFTLHLSIQCHLPEFQKQVCN